jgi:putative flippase GtrA
VSRPVRFAGVGAVGVAVQLGLIAGLDRATAWPPGVLALAAVAVVLVHNFAWHWLWTWRDRLTSSRGVGTFVLTFIRFVGANGLVSIFGNVAVTTGLAGWGLPVVAANAIAIAACGVMNYLLADRLVFGRPGVGSHDPRMPDLKVRPTYELDAHSARSAASGSTREARQAGTALATNETRTTATVAMPSVSGS